MTTLTSSMRGNNSIHRSVEVQDVRRLQLDVNHKRQTSQPTSSSVYVGRKSLNIKHQVSSQTKCLFLSLIYRETFYTVNYFSRLQ